MKSLIAALVIIGFVLAFVGMMGPNAANAQEVESFDIYSVENSDGSTTVAVEKIGGPERKEFFCGPPGHVVPGPGEKAPPRNREGPVWMEAWEVGVNFCMVMEAELKRLDCVPDLVPSPCRGGPRRGNERRR